MVKAIDFFCGAGGLTHGLIQAGIDVRAGVDIDHRLQTTYEANNQPSRFVHHDIADVNISRLRDELDIKPNDLVLYAACTPCQPFSTLNRAKHDDIRKYLLLNFADIIEDSPPDYIIVENVPGFRNRTGKTIAEQFETTLLKHGFKTASGCLDAKDYGIPQTRKRYILVASRHGEPEIPQPTHQAHYATVRDAIGNYPVIADGESHSNYHNHQARKLAPHHRKIVAAVPKNGGNRKDITDTSILLPCHQGKPNVHREVFGRMTWHKPAPTMTGRCTDVYCGRFVHPEQDRGISLREAAAIQTFPDTYRFYGTSIAENSRQIGNAVPVKLALLLGETIVNA